MEDMFGDKKPARTARSKPGSAAAHSFMLALVGFLAIACLVLLAVLIYSLFSNSADIGSQIPLP